MSSKDLRRVMIADDHAIVRNGLKDVFKTLPRIKIVAEATNGLEAISMSKDLKPDLLTLDAGMPLARGMQVFGEVRRWCPKTRIAVVTGFTAIGHLSDWVAADVDGLFLKTCPPEEMAQGFDIILNGGGYFSKASLAILEGVSVLAELTARERQVVHLIAEGCANIEIAERLSISAKTVDNHRTRLMAKLNVHSVAQLLSLALKEGLLDQSQQL